MRAQLNAVRARRASAGGAHRRPIKWRDQPHQAPCRRHNRRAAASDVFATRPWQELPTVKTVSQTNKAQTAHLSLLLFARSCTKTWQNASHLMMERGQNHRMWSASKLAITQIVLANATWTPAPISTIWIEMTVVKTNVSALATRNHADLTRELCLVSNGPKQLRF
jgi:hypothetical protein